MGNANTSVRSHLNMGVTVASAGILALGLIAAPPSSRGARIEAHAVQLTSSALRPSAYFGALEKFISNRVPATVLNTSAVQGGAFDVATVVGPTTDPTTDGELVSTAALAATPSALGPAALLSPLAALLGPLISNSIVGPFVLVGAIALGFVVGVLFIVPFEWLKAVLGGILSLPAALPLPGTVAALAEVSSTAATTLSNNAEMDRVSAATATADSGDTSVKTGKADLSTKERSAGIEQMSTDTTTSAKDVPETIEAENVSDETTEAKVNAPETPRPAVRDSLDASKQQDDRPHGKVDRSTGKTAAAAEKSGSSSAGSQSDDSSPKDGGPSGGDAGDSE